MRLLIITLVLGRDHWHRGAAVVELLVASLTAAMFLAPRDRPFPLAYVGMVVGIVACVVPALSAGLLAARAADARGEVFLLRAGRTTYYLAVVATALLTGAFWVTVLAGTFGALGVTAASPQAWPAVLTAALLNAALATALFCLFSPLGGKASEPIIAIILMIVGLNSAWTQDLGPLGRYLALALPPLMQNVQAAVGAIRPEVEHSLAYVTALLAVGILRFARRDLHRR